MKNTLKFLSASALLTLTSSLVLTGCPEVETCTTDADCGETEVCNTDVNECELKGDVCTTNADCDVAANSFCINNVNNDGTFVCGTPTTCADVAVEADKAEYCGAQTADTLCLPAASGDAGVVECRAAADCGELGGDADGINAFCRAEAGATEGDFTCNTDGDAPNCEGGVMTNHYQVIIKDTTTADCDLTVDDNGFDSGSDITFVELKDAAMMTLGWGKTVTFTQGTGMNDFTTEAVLDGLAPDLITDGIQEDIDNRCPQGANADGSDRFKADRVLTLGCGGSVIVDFPAGSDAQPIYNGQQVIVGEYATVCNQNERPDAINGTDTYEVYVCPEIEVGAAAPTDLDCVMNGVKISPDDKGGLKTSTVAGGKDAPAPATDS